MAKTFSAQVDDWIRKSENLLNGVIQEASQRVVDEALTPRAKGGRHPVDTGFLRNSCEASLGGMPSGPTSAKDGAPQGGNDQVKLTIARMRPGDKIWFGWTANYAPYMEARYAFVRMAAQKWQSTVTLVAREMVRRAAR